MRAWLQRLGHFVRRLFATGASGFLCDRCRYNYLSACSRPERPNARTCPDFKRN